MDRSNDIISTENEIPKVEYKSGSFDMWDDMNSSAHIHDPAKARRDIIKARAAKINATVTRIYIFISLRFRVPLLIVQGIVYGYVFYLMFK